MASFAKHGVWRNCTGLQWVILSLVLKRGIRCNYSWPYRDSVGGSEMRIYGLRWFNVFNVTRILENHMEKKVGNQMDIGFTRDLVIVQGVTLITAAVFKGTL